MLNLKKTHFLCIFWSQESGIKIQDFYLDVNFVNVRESSFLGNTDYTDSTCCAHCQSWLRRTAKASFRSHLHKTWEINCTKGVCYENEPAGATGTTDTIKFAILVVANYNFSYLLTSNLHFIRLILWLVQKNVVTLWLNLE